MTVAIIDYGMGNLGSVSGALAELGASPVITRQPADLAGADRIILPGVGSFAEGMENLTGLGWVNAIRREVEAGKPLLGICLGMQLLATRGTEGGDIAGLDFVPGVVKRLDTAGCDQRIPHVGWNSLAVTGRSHALLEGIPDGTDFYFVHSYVLEPANEADVIGRTDYAVPFTSAVGRTRVLGTQFHPETSSKAGFRVLRNFLSFT